MHIKVLCLVKELFVHIPPNISAWCEALESFFRSLGYKVDAKPQPTNTPAHSPNATPRHPTHWMGLGLPHLLQPHPVSLVPKMTNNQHRLAPSSPATFRQSTYALSVPLMLRWGQVEGSAWGWYKKRCSGHEDDPRNPTDTVFLPQADLDEMEADVEVLRNPPYTGIMALLCRHDRVIYLANMTSAGEKQHHALTLLKALFDQLPLDFRVGVLYDIGCQLECSCRKWGFLETFLPRMTFAISVFHAFDRKSLVNLGGWLRHRWDHCQEKKKSALDGLNKSGVDRATLRTEWQAQVATQTKPPREEAVMQIISIQKSLEAQEATLHELESSQLLGNIDVATLDIQLADCRSNISRFKRVLHQKRAAVGSSHECLRAESSPVEIVYDSGSLRWTELNGHTGRLPVVSAKPYASSDPPEKGTPRSNPPLPIARDGLFKLDVDDNIWQGVGLDDDSSEAPPGWLSDEKVRLGIHSLLEVEHCEEEERCLATERWVMQEWFAEEWSRIQRVREVADDDLAYELGLHCADLAELCVEWQTQVRMIPCPSPMAGTWGPSPEQLTEAARMKVSSIYIADYREEVVSEDECVEESEDSISNLATVEDFALVDKYHSQLGGEDFGIGDWDWDDMLDLDPPSSPSKSYPLGIDGPCQSSMAPMGSPKDNIVGDVPL
ncbi:hypothetical protein BU15DRAFT_59931 [Melanogaster broomeanus]|nr:hypothetical protein BU15DRAFT_59931 [Melanogaster broomeanus]